MALLEILTTKNGYKFAATNLPLSKEPRIIDSAKLVEFFDESKTGKPLFSDNALFRNRLDAISNARPEKGENTFIAGEYRLMSGRKDRVHNNYEQSIQYVQISEKDLRAFIKSLRKDN